MSQKSYDEKKAIFLIPTPIGNMEDITIRSINTLKKVDIIFSEDTRVTGILLKELGITKKVISNHNFNEKNNKDILIKYMDENLNIGLVSDRGTPIISDPGFELVKIAIEYGYKVIALPGPTALIPALITSGLDCSRFFFFGFLNQKESKLKKELIDLKNIKNTMIFYESTHRIIKTLESMLEIFGDRRISISREISKLYEEIYRGRISEVLEELTEIKGEFVIVVEGNNDIKKIEVVNLIEHIEIYIQDGMSNMEAIKKVSKERKIPKSEVYEMFISNKNGGNL